MQRHLQTKHQIKREESPPIPYHPTTAPDGTTSSMLDIKPPPFLNYPYYAHPPWLGQVGQHDYHGYYQHQGRLTSISFSSSNTQFYESRISISQFKVLQMFFSFVNNNLYIHFWVYFDINLKLLSGKNTQKVKKQNIRDS